MTDFVQRPSVWTLGFITIEIPSHDDGGWRRCHDGGSRWAGGGTELARPSRMLESRDRAHNVAQVFGAHLCSVRGLSWIPQRAVVRGFVRPWSTPSGFLRSVDSRASSSSLVINHAGSSQVLPSRYTKHTMKKTDTWYMRCSYDRNPCKNTRPRTHVAPTIEIHAKTHALKHTLLLRSKSTQKHTPSNTRCSYSRIPRKTHALKQPRAKHRSIVSQTVPFGMMCVHRHLFRSHMVVGWTKSLYGMLLENAAWTSNLLTSSFSRSNCSFSLSRALPFSFSVSCQAR